MVRCGQLFTGDADFPGFGPDNGCADFDSLVGDLQEKAFGKLSDDTWFYAGHGNDSTLGRERGSNPGVAPPHPGRERSRRRRTLGDSWPAGGQRIGHVAIRAGRRW